MNIFIKKILIYCSISFALSHGIHHTVSIIGTGYVGLVTGACLADMHDADTLSVTCLDIDSIKIKNLQNGIIPIYEPGLAEIVQKNVARNTLSFSDDIAWHIAQSDSIVIAVGTPTQEDGSVDTTYFYSALEQIVRNTSQKSTTIIIKSTVPIGTGKKTIEYIKKNALPSTTIHVISNPEFLREGTAVYDTMNPDRIVIGSSSFEALSTIQKLYQPFFQKNTPILYTDLTTAETIKYAANNFLAVKLSFINEIANLCDKTGAQIQDVAKGIGLDKRIGHSFLQPGPGFGGSCLPKDTRGLLATAKEYAVALHTIQGAVTTNEYQKLMPYRKLKQHIPSDQLSGKTIAILGLSFKANTDDIRYSAAIPLIQKLLDKGTKIQAYDPQAMPHMKQLFPDITYCDTSYKALTNADAVLLLTEWDEFKNLDLSIVKSVMKGFIIIDSRNLLDTKQLTPLGFCYSGIGTAR